MGINNLDVSGFSRYPKLINPEYMLAQRAGYFSDKNPCQFISDMDSEEYPILAKENFVLSEESAIRDLKGMCLGFVLGCLGFMIGGGPKLLSIEHRGEVIAIEPHKEVLVAVAVGLFAAMCFGECCCPIFTSYRDLPSTTEIEINRESRLTAKIRKISDKILQLEGTTNNNTTNEIDQLYQARSYFKSVNKKFR